MDKQQVTKKEEVVFDPSLGIKLQALREIRAKNQRQALITQKKQESALQRIIQLRRWVMSGFTPKWRFQQGA